MPWWDNRKAVIKCSKRFDQKQEEWEARTEETVGLRLCKSQRLSKRDLLKMIEWKFSFLPPRVKRYLKMVESTPESRISEQFTRALKANDETSRIAELDELPAVGPAMASVILVDEISPGQKLSYCFWNRYSVSKSWQHDSPRLSPV